MKNIVILAAGPSKPNRNRHLEIHNGQKIIDVVIRKCTIENTKIYAVVDSSNKELADHIKDRVEIINPKGPEIYKTFEAALSIPGDTIMVVGDILGLKDGDINRFIESDHKSATCIYKQAWGNHIRSHYPNLIRRGDCGDCISMIAQEHKEEFLGSDNQTISKWMFKQFYPERIINPFIYNDIGTFMSFAFFKEIWSNPLCSEFSEKGSIYFEHRVYADND
jgi:GTP:adenosylcobinamide-phosphate guanylyltransferase